MSDNGDTPGTHIAISTSSIVGNALSRVKIMGELGMGAVALRDIYMVVQLQLDIS